MTDPPKSPESPKTPRKPKEKPKTQPKTEQEEGKKMFQVRLGGRENGLKIAKGNASLSDGQKSLDAYFKRYHYYPNSFPNGIFTQPKKRGAPRTRAAPKTSGVSVKGKAAAVSVEEKNAEQEILNNKATPPADSTSSAATDYQAKQHKGEWRTVPRELLGAPPAGKH